jgi:positive regulator of sigma E activity
MEDVTREDRGKVVEIKGRKVTVEICPASGCASCGMCAGGNKSRFFTLDTNVPVKLGDEVMIRLYGGSEVVSSLILFLMPILFMIIGFVIAFFVFHLPEGKATLAGIAGLGVSFIAVKLIDYLYGKKIYMDIVPGEEDKQ